MGVIVPYYLSFLISLTSVRCFPNIKFKFVDASLLIVFPHQRLKRFYCLNVQYESVNPTAQKVGVRSNIHLDHFVVILAPFISMLLEECFPPNNYLSASEDYPDKGYEEIIDCNPLELFGCCSSLFSI